MFNVLGMGEQLTQCMYISAGGTKGSSPKKDEVKGSPDILETQERRGMHRRAFGSTQMQLSPSMDHIAIARQIDDEAARITPIDIEFHSSDGNLQPGQNNANDRPQYHHSREISMSSFSKSPDILPR